MYFTYRAQVHIRRRAKSHLPLDEEGQLPAIPPLRTVQEPHHQRHQLLPQEKVVLYFTKHLFFFCVSLCVFFRKTLFRFVVFGL